MRKKTPLRSAPRRRLDSDEQGPGVELLPDERDRGTAPSLAASILRVSARRKSSNESEKESSGDPEQGTDEDDGGYRSKDVTFPCGALLWVKFAKYPWWPAVVVDDPKTGVFYKPAVPSSQTCDRYHVCFFGDHSRAWVTNFSAFELDHAKNYYGCPGGEGGGGSKRRKNVAQQWKDALEECLVASKMSAKARRTTFGPPSTMEEVKVAEDLDESPKRRRVTDIARRKVDRMSLRDLIVADANGGCTTAGSGGTLKIGSEETLSGRENSNPCILAMDVSVKDEEDVETEDPNEEICGVCCQPGDIICCEGPCFRSFHLECIGLKKAPTGRFLCDPCAGLAGQPCFLCKRAEAVSRPNSSSRRRTSSITQPCAEERCGKFYHPSCVYKLPNTVGISGSSKDTFTCAIHACGSCELRIDPNERETIRCAWCPISYHRDCAPPGLVFVHENYFLCPRHVLLGEVDHCKLDIPYENFLLKAPKSLSRCVACGIGGELICCDGCPAVYHAMCIGETDSTLNQEDRWFCESCLSGKQPTVGDVVWAKVGAYRWWPAVVCGHSEATSALKRSTHFPFQFPINFFGSHSFTWASNWSIISWTSLDQTGNLRKGFTLEQKFVNAMEEVRKLVVSPNTFRC